MMASRRETKLPEKTTESWRGGVEGGEHHTVDAQEDLLLRTEEVQSRITR